jgi:PPOX class probable F420-dependent enzyme
MGSFWTLVVAGSVAAAQPASPAQPPEKERIVAAAAELMRAAGLCALVTLDAAGTPQARAMQPFAPEADLTVWMATNAGTRKVEQIRRDPRVTLFYLAPDGTGYVTLLGRATLVDDPAEKAKRWNPSWDAFYEDRNRGSDYLLLRVTPVRVEVVSATHGIAVEPKSWKPASVDLP